MALACRAPLMCYKCNALGRALAAVHGNARLPVDFFDFPFPAVGCVAAWRARGLLGLRPCLVSSAARASHATRSRRAAPPPCLLRRAEPRRAAAAGVELTRPAAPPQLR